MPVTASLGIFPFLTFEESTKMPVSCQHTLQPRLFNRLTMENTSVIRGQFRIKEPSLTSNVAASTGSEAFFDPCMRTFP